MWRPPINFVTIHYTYIILIGLLAFPILYPDGNLSAIDAYHFGVSSSTESGLNTVDLKDLHTYQQLFLYFIPIFTNLGFINAVVVVVRLFWFRKHLKKLAPALLGAKRRASPHRDDVESAPEQQPVATAAAAAAAAQGQVVRTDTTRTKEDGMETSLPNGKAEEHTTSAIPSEGRLNNQPPLRNPYEDSPPVSPGVAAFSPAQRPPIHPHPQSSSFALTLSREDHPTPRSRITFDPAADQHPNSNSNNDATLSIPGPRERDRGAPILELSETRSLKIDDLDEPSASQMLRRRRTDGSRLAEARSIDRVATVATSVFVIGSGPGVGAGSRSRRVSFSQQPALNDVPFLSRQATIGRNSQFHNLTSEDREALGGIEYRSLKLLLKVVVAYYLGLHLIGVICLLPWIKLAAPVYREALKESALSETWWAFYSAQTMVNNLGLTLTPNSMISFRDAEWPMLVMTLLAFAGNTFYPVFLRLVLWTLGKLTPRRYESIHDPLRFLLAHPRRCYTLLFPSKVTWVLFGILFALNFIDTLLIIVLDLDNPEVTALTGGKRFLAALFQAASARHTGTSTFALSNVSPGVHLSLLVMMYISVFPVAISIRASNTYEERSLGIYEKEADPDDIEASASGTSYLIKHMQNQLSFDLWYIFLGVFCLAVSESSRIMDAQDPAFNMFAILFEVTSAYANVGLSLGYPTVNVSLCGKFKTFGKLVICVMMIRGRHRGLPYQLDRAIMLPDEHLIERAVAEEEEEKE